jgi:hypothetical protein
VVQVLYPSRNAYSGLVMDVALEGPQTRRVSIVSSSPDQNFKVELIILA